MRGIIGAVGRVRAGLGVLLALTALGVMAPGAQADTVKASASAEVVIKRGDRGAAVRQMSERVAAATRSFVTGDQFSEGALLAMVRTGLPS